jgi:hypothetical protein
LPRNARVVAAAVVLMLLAAGCAKSEKTGLRVKGYAADLVFGAAKRPALVPVAAAPGPPPVVEAPLPPAVFDNTGFKAPPSIGSSGPCKSAALGAGALDSATVAPTLAKRPETGTSRWKRTGTITITGGNTKVPFAGFEQRIVRDVRDGPTGTFLYQTVKPDTGSPTTFVTTWQVKPDAVQQNVSELTASVTVGDPERGLTIKAIDNFAANGEMIGSFRPATGLLILPLPVVPGEQFASVAVDPQTLQVATYQGQVVSRDRTDACGDYVEGWVVKGTLTFAGQTPQQYDVLVATQYGVVVVSEHIVGQTALGTYDLTFGLGQLHPS